MNATIMVNSLAESIAESPHLFWIIEKKNIIVRNGIHRYMAMYENKKTITPKHLDDSSQLYMAFIESTWVRVKIESGLQNLSEKTLESNEYLCWLVDFGIMKKIRVLYEIPDDLRKCPKLARQASLYNVVNCKLSIDDDGYKFKKITQKVLEPIAGISRLGLSLLQSAEKWFFEVEDECDGIFYGDIVYIKRDSDTEFSLKEELIANNVMEVDEDLFQKITYREYCRKIYFRSKMSWLKPLDKAGKLEHRSEIIFEEELNEIPFEYFKRRINPTRNSNKLNY